MVHLFQRKEKEINTPKKIDFFGFFVAPLFVLIMLEIMHLANFSEYYTFFGNAFFLLKWFISYVFLLLLQCVLLVIIPNLFAVHTIEIILLFLLGTASEILMAVKGNPLLPTDFLLVGTLGETVGFVDISIPVQCIISLVFTCFSIRFFAVRRKKIKSKLTKVQKISFALVSIILFSVMSYGMSFNRAVKYRFFPEIQINLGAFNPRGDFYSNGLILSFFPRLGELVVETPEGYSEEKIKEIKDKAPQYAAGETKANVIAIQSEALWDITKLPGSEFSQDPMKNIRRIAKEKNAVSGTFISPVFGGGTCMPEFEFLTGFTTVFYSASSCPYIQTVTKPTESLVTYYKQNGYETFAVHPYKKNFYSRDTAYPLLGFDKFIGDEDMTEPEYKGLYISDMEVTRQLISAYENKQKDRIFEYAVTMQNHGGYTFKRYDNYDITATNPDFDETDSLILQEYAQGVYDADVAFNELVEYFKTVDEPTIIIMYGDHLPLLGDGGATYVNSGYVNSTIEEFRVSDYKYLFETPYIIWANYDVDLSNVSDFACAANLGIYVSNLAGIEDLPWYYSSIKAFYEQYPVYSPYNIYDNQYNAVLTAEEEYENMVKGYKFIQYDLTHGKNYAKQ